MFADASIFRVFTLPLRLGDPQTALAVPRTIVLSEMTARKYFGAANPLGQTLRLDNVEDYRSAASFATCRPTHISTSDLIASLESIEKAVSPSGTVTIFLPTCCCGREAIRPPCRPSSRASSARHLGPWIKQVLGRSIDEVFASGTRLEYHLQPLARYPFALAIAQRNRGQRRHPYHLYFFRHRPADPGHCRHQFHQPVHGPFGRSGPGKRESAKYWGRNAGSWCANSWPIRCC